MKLTIYNYRNALPFWAVICLGGVPGERQTPGHAASLGTIAFDLVTRTGAWTMLQLSMLITRGEWDGTAAVQPYQRTRPC